MIEQDIAALVARDRVNLDGLEADVWRRERAERASQKAGRALMSLQATVIAFSVVFSAATGVTLATERAQASPVALFNPGADLAPSSLLFGKRP